MYVSDGSPVPEVGPAPQVGPATEAGPVLEVDPEEMRAVAREVAELRLALAHLQGRTAEALGVKLPLGTSSQASDLNRKFHDRVEVFRERLDTMAAQLDGIHTSVDRTRAAYDESEQVGREGFARR